MSRKSWSRFCDKKDMLNEGVERAEDATKSRSALCELCTPVRDRRCGRDHICRHCRRSVVSDRRKAHFCLSRKGTRLFLDRQFARLVEQEDPRSSGGFDQRLELTGCRDVRNGDVIRTAAEPRSGSNLIDELERLTRRSR